MFYDMIMTMARERKQDTRVFLSELSAESCQAEIWYS